MLLRPLASSGVANAGLSGKARDIQGFPPVVLNPCSICGKYEPSRNETITGTRVTAITEGKRMFSSMKWSSVEFLLAHVVRRLKIFGHWDSHHGGTLPLSASTFRRFASPVVPHSILSAIKRRYYVRLLRSLAPEPDAVLCREYVHSGEAIVDLGANIGAYTKFFAEWVGTEGHVYAVEPVPETFNYLQNNMYKLGLTNVSCYNVAVSSYSGWGYVSVPEYRDGGANLYQAFLTDHGIRVHVFRVDDLFPDLCPAFIKCDVEGAELEVVKGAVKLIERCHPMWLIEVIQSQLFEMMRSQGYKARKAHSDWLFYH